MLTTLASTDYQWGTNLTPKKLGAITSVEFKVSALVGLITRLALSFFIAGAYGAGFFLGLTALSEARGFILKVVSRHPMQEERRDFHARLIKLTHNLLLILLAVVSAWQMHAAHLSIWRLPVVYLSGYVFSSWCSAACIVLMRKF